MSIVVQKYGGSSVANPEKIQGVARRIARTAAGGHRVCVVVSAMGDTTDDLLALAKKVTASPNRRELDMLLSVGERISMALLSMALHDLGVDAISFTGSQSGIITNDTHANARIVEVRPYRLQDELERGRVVIVAGYQGVSYRKEVTTLGRGGSDTTAVALAAALGAEYCEICSDVDGVYTADPRAVPAATKLAELSYEDMQALAEAGAKVLNAQAVEFARAKGIAIYAKATFVDGPGTVVRDGAMKRLDGPPEPGRVVAVASEEDIAIVRISRALAGDARGLTTVLEKHGIPARHVAMEDGAVSVLISKENAHLLRKAAAELADSFADRLAVDETRATVAYAGASCNDGHKHLTSALEALAAAEISVTGIDSTPHRATFIIPRGDGARAARALHARLIER